MSLWPAASLPLTDPARRAFMSNGSCFGGSHIASKKEIMDMLKLAAEKNVRPWVDQVLPMSEAGKAIQGVKDNKVGSQRILPCMFTTEDFPIGPIPIRVEERLEVKRVKCSNQVVSTSITARRVIGMRQQVPIVPPPRCGNEPPRRSGRHAYLSRYPVLPFLKGSIDAVVKP